MVEMCNYLLLEKIRKFRNSDDAEFESIYSEFGRLIELYVRRLGGEDYYQELMLFLIELLHKIDIDKFAVDDSDGVKRYITVCITNKYIALSKEKHQTKTQNISLEEAEKFLPFFADEYFEIGDDLQQLSEKQKKVIIYKYILNYSDAEIAQFLNISRQAVNQIKNRAFTVLKKIYSEAIE